MNLYCIKCTNNNDIKKREINGKISLYSCCINRGFKKFVTVYEE